MVEAVTQKMLEAISEELDGKPSAADLWHLSQALLSLQMLERAGQFIPYDPTMSLK